MHGVHIGSTMKSLGCHSMHGWSRQAQNPAWTQTGYWYGGVGVYGGGSSGPFAGDGKQITALGADEFGAPVKLV